MAKGKKSFSSTALEKKKPSKQRSVAAATTAKITAQQLPQPPSKIMSTSDALYQHRDIATKRIVQAFYQSVRIPIEAHAGNGYAAAASASTLVNNVVIGDLCAVQCVAGFKMPPFEHARWKVAQILTLFMETTPQTDAKEIETSSKQEYFAHVRWMAHCKQEGHGLLSKEEQKKLNEQFRTDQMLLETCEIARIPLSAILPAAIVVQDYQKFGDKDLVAPEPITDLQPDSPEMKQPQDSGKRHRRSRHGSLDSCWKVFFWCSRRVDKSIHTHRDWQDYCDQIRPTTTTAMANAGVRATPSVLLRGWQDFRNQALPLNAVANDWTDDHLSRLTDALVKGYCNQQLLQPDQFQVISTNSGNSVNNSVSLSQEQEQEVEDAMEVQDDAADDDDRVNKENARQNRKSKSGKQPARTASRKRPSATTTATTTARAPQPAAQSRPAKRTSVLKATTVSKKAGGPTKKRPSKEIVTSTRGKTKTNKSNKKRRVSLDDSNSEEAVQAGESDQDSDSPSIVPISDGAVYVPKKSKKNNNRNDADPLLQYFQGVELDLDASRCDRKVRSRLASRWQVQVGDLIAVSCDVSTKPDKSPEGGKNIWYPFTIPWTPAQVLAVYHDEGDYMMELRWLYRPADLNEEVLENMPEDILKDLFDDGVLSRRMIVEFDEHVDESPVEAALGRIVTTSESSPSSSWLDTFKSKDRIPQVPLVCKYSGEVNDSSIKPVDDWTDYGKSQASAGPVGRGILCPKSRLEKDPKLRKFYEKIVRSRYGFVGEFKKLPDYAPPPTPDGKVVISWPADMLDGASVNVPLDTENILYKSDGPAGMSTEFFKSVRVSVEAKRCASRVTTRSDNSWSLQVGDVVCLANNKANKVAHQSSTTNPWYPYLGPWGFCQVLAIYRDAPSSQPLLEVRHFCRLADLPIHVKSWKPGSDDSKTEEIYETEVVESGIPASRVLGRVDLFLGHFKEISNMKANSNDGEIPVASCRCRYFYDASFQRLQPIFCSGTRPTQWFRRMLERGFKASKSIKDHAELAEHSLGIGLPSDGIVETLQDKIQIESKPVETPLFEYEQESGPQREYLLSSSLLPPWASYAQHDSICSDRDRKNLMWTVKVGDIVAVSTDEDSASQDQEWYPFSRPWRPCQIVAMYREISSVTQERWLVQVRWFKRERELPITPKHSLVVPGLEPLYETDVLSTEGLDNSMLLGPIALFSNSGAEASATVWKGVDPFLPVAPFVYSGSYVGEKYHHSGMPSDHSKMLRPIIKRGIDLSNHYSDEEKETVLVALDVHEVSGPSEEAGAWMTDAPFHVDHATNTEYYTKLNLHPPYSEYATNLPAIPTENLPVWTVRLGDVVVIRYGKKSLGKSLYPHPADKGGLSFPMRRPWAVGEVVTIMKASESTDLSGIQQPPDDLSSGEDIENPPDDLSSGEDIENILLEIRWFYKKAELPGSSRDEKARSRVGDECEEIFETDHYDKVSPSSVLAPAVLHPTGRSIRAGRVELGMPVLEFCCSQYYSVFGQSNLACGGLDGRIERGRVHSSYFGKDAALKKALDHIRSTGSTLAMGSTHAISSSWKEPFNRVIEKLALTDASKEAYENRSALIGREEEKQEILSFLEAAISGESTDNKASIFIAGPPGTGKTASVRAAISELQDAQSRGMITNFDFISLNGMEMRHPFEAYVRLWEELKWQQDGDKKMCSPEIAAAKLEALFTNKGVAANNKDKGRVAVVLVDEIDYLVTKKQTVLYNLFDWPNRALQCGSKNRLVVIGVSNTLNLPERLHPRVQSRIGSRRCYFKSYNFKQTVAILKAKMTQASPSYTVFDDDAIIFASRKTAALSGDLRKAFHICRAAAEMVMEEAEKNEQLQKEPIVRIKDVLKVSRESFNSAQSKAVSLCTSFEALLLVSLAALSKSTGRESGGFDVEELLAKMEGTANAFGDMEYLPAPSLPETLGMLTRLGEAHLVSLQTPRTSSVSYRAALAGSGGAWPLVSLQVDDIAIMLALRQSPHNELAQKYLVTNSC